ncbi:YciI family protein [Rhizobium leguminosarum]|uniref:YciI family protein n=1 Tax=Rhizobium leguminosarum TaxID=384 RepID=UPI0014425BCE|nr:YciI family protein [Rhizobium leguminosarum]MBY5864016.1 YciI family protein [Rhizobium leguminosarum]NKM03029.1 YciI family protein [Rhizobium leguminosarum bv. viciae]
MIVARYAVSDPCKAAERSRLLDEHKAYLHGAPIRILLSGPSAPPSEGKGSTAIAIAQVETLAEFEAFSAGDPFVRSGIYASVDIFEWRPSFGLLLESL